MIEKTRKNISLYEYLTKEGKEYDKFIYGKRFHGVAINKEILPVLQKNEERILELLVGTKKFVQHYLQWENKFRKNESIPLQWHEFETLQPEINQWHEYVDGGSEGEIYRIKNFKENNTENKYLILKAYHLQQNGLEEFFGLLYGPEVEKTSSYQNQS